MKEKFMDLLKICGAGLTVLYFATTWVLCVIAAISPAVIPGWMNIVLGIIGMPCAIAFVLLIFKEWWLHIKAKNEEESA